MRAFTFLALASCGRVGFAARDAGDGGAVDAPAVRDTFGGAQPIANVSSASREFGVSIGPDELELYFVSNRGTGFTTYVATRGTTAEVFSAASPAKFGGAGFDGEPAVARDGLAIFMTSPASGCVVATRAAGGPWSAPVTVPGFDQFGGFDVGDHDLRMVMQSSDDRLFEAARADRASPWQPPVLLAELLGNRAHQNYPTMTDDGLEIFFQAYDDTGTGTILHARRPAVDQPFGVVTAPLVVPVGVSLGDPGISPDGRTLYYSSDESNPGGGGDLWVATRDR